MKLSVMKFLTLGIAMLFMNGYNVASLDATSRAYCRVYPDPHFSTWHNDFYDYHGGCDLVLITNSLLDFHIRTKNFTGWSGITAVGIKIGTNRLEIYEPTGSIFVNAVDVTASPPTAISGYPFSVIVGPPAKFRIDLAGGQYIEVTRTYLNTLQVDVLGHGSNFGDSEGLCANWTASSPNALRGRDGTTIYPLTNPVPYGEEWQVDSLLGDPVIFSTPAESTCLYTTGECRNPQATDTKCQERQARAVDACKAVTTERNARANCEFDVRVTNDITFANTTAYTNPIIGNPVERCIEVVNVTNVDASNGGPIGNCTILGGKCVWLCDKTLYNCIESYCKGPDQGCACAIPLPTAPTPVNAPSPIQAPTPNQAPIPIAAPTPIQGPTPVQPPTPAQAPAPIPAPRPIAPTPVQAPTPNQAPRPIPAPTPNQTPKPIPASTPIKVPTPVQRPIPVSPPTPVWCLLGIFCFDECGRLARFFGLC